MSILSSTQSSKVFCQWYQFCDKFVRLLGNYGDTDVPTDVHRFICRMQFVTTFHFTNVLCERRTSREPFGPSTRTNIVREDHRKC